MNRVKRSVPFKLFIPFSYFNYDKRNFSKSLPTDTFLANYGMTQIQPNFQTSLIPFQNESKTQSFSPTNKIFVRKKVTIFLLLNAPPSETWTTRQLFEKGCRKWRRSPRWRGEEKVKGSVLDGRGKASSSMHATHEYPSTRRPSIIQYRTYGRPLLSWHVTP